MEDADYMVCLFYIKVQFYITAASQLKLQFQPQDVKYYPSNIKTGSKQAWMACGCSSGLDPGSF